jgi:hypothetical protein
MMRDLFRLAKSTIFLKQVVVPERDRERERERANGEASVREKMVGS